MKKLLVFLAAMSLVFCVVGSASAITIIAGYTFEDDAFADSLYGSQLGGTSFVWFDDGSGNFYPTIAEFEASVVGSDITQGTALSGSDYMTLSFDDNYIVNAVGADFVVFEIGLPADFADVDVQLLGINNSYTTTETGSYTGNYSINAVAINLDDFGIASGGYVDLVSIINAGGDFDLAVVGALNSAPVPEPATMLLLGFGLIGLALGRKKFFRKGR